MTDGFSGGTGELRRVPRREVQLGRPLVDQSPVDRHRNRQQRIRSRPTIVGPVPPRTNPRGRLDGGPNGRPVRGVAAPRDRARGRGTGQENRPGRYVPLGETVRVLRRGRLAGRRRNGRDGRRGQVQARRAVSAYGRPKIVHPLSAPVRIQR